MLDNIVRTEFEDGFLYLKQEEYYSDVVNPGGGETPKITKIGCRMMIHVFPVSSIFRMLIIPADDVEKGAGDED